MFGPKSFGVKGGWRKLHNEELHNLYSSPSIIQMIKSKGMILSRSCSTNWEKRNACRLMVGREEGKRSLGG
jgi:hypothetical protein